VNYDAVGRPRTDHDHASQLSEAPAAADRNCEFNVPPQPTVVQRVCA
jgi:hypothetical protein